MMTVIEELLQRNEAYVQDGFTPDLPMAPAKKTMVLGCVDSRVDPAHLLGLNPGEAIVIRNVGGRVEPGALQNIALLGAVAKAAGSVPGAGWNLVVLHHTDCGIRHCHTHAPQLLAKQLNVPVDDLGKLEVDDPYKSVVVDVAALKANPNMPGGFTVSGLVYDVHTGHVETVVPPSKLREEG
jgi:carbonic anhydrase